MREGAAAAGGPADGGNRPGPDAGPVWGRPRRGTRGPAPERSRGQITAAAIALADAGGLDAVSMRQVAGALGTGPASLYRYIASRDDLIDLMADEIAAEIDLESPVAQDPITALVDLAVQVKAVYLRHPWLLDVMAQRTPLGPRAVDYMEHVLRILEPVQAPIQAKLETVGVLTGLVNLFARTEVNLRREGATYDQQRAGQAAYLATAAADGNHPQLLAAFTAAASAPTAEPDGALFERVMRKLLNALVN